MVLTFSSVLEFPSLPLCPSCLKKVFAMDSLLILNHFADQPNHLTRFGVTFGLKFGVNQCSVDGDLEAASV